MPDELSNAVEVVASPGAEPEPLGVQASLTDPVKGPQSMDFRVPAPLGMAARRRLRLRHDEFARSLSTRLSIYLRLETQIAVTSLELARCQAWLDRLLNPTHLTLFTLDSQPSRGVLEIAPSLAFIFVDRLLGGTGDPENVTRGLTEIETVVGDEIVRLFLREWAEHLPLPERIRVAVAGHEDNSRFVQVAAPEAPLLALGLQVTIKGATHGIQMGVPFALLEPVLAEVFSPEPQIDHPAETLPAKPVWNPQLDQVRIPLTARCEDFEVSARRLAGLQVGDVLAIESARLNRVQVRLATVPKFVGRLGRQGKNRAVELTALFPK